MRTAPLTAMKLSFHNVLLLKYLKSTWSLCNSFSLIKRCMQ